jgi:type I restriction enzyme S subunit
MAIFNSPQFLEYVNDKAHGGVRMNFKYEYLEDWEIPLPSIEMQVQLTKDIADNLAVIRHADALGTAFRFDASVFPNCERVLLDDVATIERGKFAHRPRNDPRFYHGNYPFIQINDITNDVKFISTYEQTLNDRGLEVSKMFPKGTLVMSIASSIGEIGILTFDAWFPDSIVAISPRDDRICLDYLFWYCKCFKDSFIAMASQAIQKNINVQKLKTYRIPLPDLKSQQEIVNALDKQLADLQALSNLRKNATTRFHALVESCWNGEK